jgi:biotin synthase
MHQIFKKITAKAELSREEIIKLLSIGNTSSDYYRLLYLARKQSEESFGKRGYVFAQIGIHAEPCSINCRFCSMAAGHYVLPDRRRKTVDEITEIVRQLVAARVSDIFLMTTADYPVEKFIEIGNAARQYIPSEMRLAANIGDFDLPTARRLKDAGFTGAYHLVRMRESIDTGTSVEQRVRTLEAIRAASLELYYCVEPIGPEHSYEEIAAEIFRARDYQTEAMSVMRRTPVEGTPLFGNGTISTPELYKIAAVALLTVRPARKRSFIHTCACGCCRN